VIAVLNSQVRTVYTVRDSFCNLSYDVTPISDHTVSVVKMTCDYQ
jgi:hypothetical protein